MNRNVIIVIILLIVFLLFGLFIGWDLYKRNPKNISKRTTSSKGILTASELQKETSYPIKYRRDYPFPYEDIPYDYEDFGYSYGLVEVPRPAVSKGALKYFSDKYKYRNYYGKDYLLPTKFVTSLDTELVNNLNYYTSEKLPPGDPNPYGIYQPVDTPWDKVGIATSIDENDNTTLTVYKRAIDPYREFYQYIVEDKNGIVIPLKQTYLEDNENIGKIVGKESKGDFKVHLFGKDTYVYV